MPKIDMTDNGHDSVEITFRNGVKIVIDQYARHDAERGNYYGVIVKAGDGHLTDLRDLRADEKNFLNKDGDKGFLLIRKEFIPLPASSSACLDLAAAARNADPEFRAGAAADRKARLEELIFSRTDDNENQPQHSGLRTGASNSEIIAAFRDDLREARIAVENKPIG